MCRYPLSYCQRWVPVTPAPVQASLDSLTHCGTRGLNLRWLRPNTRCVESLHQQSRLVLCESGLVPYQILVRFDRGEEGWGVVEAFLLSPYFDRQVVANSTVSGLTYGSGGADEGLHR
ncbi:hypothetical protein U1Q18_014946 [Sarracenia purpurea var. burkii]